MTVAERNMDELVLNVGKVTAYADAVAGGYQGTREEWDAALAGIGQEATAALAAKEGAEAAQAAAETAQGSAETAGSAAAASAQAAAASAADAHTDALAASAAKEGAEAAQTFAGQAAQAAAGAAGTAATAQVGAEAAQTAAETAALAAATSAEGAALSEDAAVASATAAAGSAEDAQEVLNSIPEDYSTLSNDVVELKSDVKQITGGKKPYAYMNRQIWTQGVIRTDTGASSSNSTTTRARTLGFTPDKVNFVHAEAPITVDGHDYEITFRVYAYNPDGSFVGTWNGAGTFHKSTTDVPFVPYFDCSKYPQYNFRIMCQATYTDEGGETVSLSPLIDYIRSVKIFSRYARNQLRILFIGNSLTQDSIAYLPLLIPKFLPDTSYEITNVYYSGNTLAQIYQHLVNEDTATLGLISNNPKWTNTTSSFQFIVKTYPYDIVCLQGYYNYQDDSEVTAYNNIKAYIADFNAQNNGCLPLKFITLIHAPKRDDIENIYTKTLTDCGLILKNTICEDVIPTGTAIYYATKTALNSLGDQGGLSTDGTHAQEGLPVLIENYAALLWIANYLGENIQIYGTDFRFTADDYTNLDPPGPNLGTGVITGTDAENLLGQECAIQAYKFGLKFRIENLA